MPRPNILLITTDQQRVDTLSCMGAPVGRTPHIDALAARGVLFEQCHIQNPVCIPSRACLQTGRYPHQHGVRYMEEVIDNTPGLPPWEWTFFERLRAAGYHTAAFGKIHMMPERGFDTMQVTGGKGQRWVYSTGMEIGPGPLGPQYAAWLESRHPGSYERIYEQRRHPEYKEYLSALVHPLPASEHVETWIGNNVVEFISSPPSEPWFAWCGFTGPHGPLDIPPEYLERYDPEEMPEPDAWEHDLSDRFPYRGRRPRALTPEWSAKARRFTAYYHALMDLIDDQVARIVEVFDRRGLWENTLILFTSDHGEMRGDFGLYGKGNFYEVVTRVPTFIVPPGSAGSAPLAPQGWGERPGSAPPAPQGWGVRGAEPAAGACFPDLVEMFDLAPTALDYAGLPIAEQMAARSLRPEIETGRGGRDAVFCEFVTNDRRRSGVCVRTETHKLALWAGGGEHGGELYDLAEDPGERVNRWADPACAPIRKELTERILARWLEVDCPAPCEEWPGAM